MSDQQIKGGSVFSSSKLVNAVTQRLFDTIEQGRWVVDQMLPGQRELTEQIEISRPSLRGAIMVLETLGVVRSLSGKSVMVLEHSEPLREVATLDEATMKDVLQLRYALEPFIVGIVAQSARAAETSELRLLLLDLRGAIEDGDPQALVEAYTAPHRRLVKLTSNPIFLSIFEQIGSALERSDNLVRRRPEYAEEILQEHDAILRTIRQCGGERASQAMRQHILNEGAHLNIDLCLPQARSPAPEFQPGTVATPGRLSSTACEGP